MCVFMFHINYYEICINDAIPVLPGWYVDGELFAFIQIEMNENWKHINIFSHFRKFKYKIVFNLFNLNLLSN